MERQVKTKTDAVMEHVCFECSMAGTVPGRLSHGDESRRDGHPVDGFGDVLQEAQPVPGADRERRVRLAERGEKRK